MGIINVTYEFQKRMGLKPKNKKNKRKAYHRFLQTKHWRKTKNKILSGKKSCEQCGSKEKLQTHHKTYDHLGFEYKDDLILLCNSCHEKIHNIRSGNLRVPSGAVYKWVEGRSNDDAEPYCYNIGRSRIVVRVKPTWPFGVLGGVALFWNVASYWKDIETHRLYLPMGG